MRYTTIIDISEWPELYANRNIRLLYLHMCLRAGYHDNDRDWLRASIRSLAADTGLTESATRHGLKRLLAAKLIARKENYWLVRKWIPEQPITARAKTKRAAELEQQRQVREAADMARESQHEAYKKEQKALEAEGKDSYMLYYESLIERAAMGDEHAAAMVEKNRENYENHKRNFEKK